MTGRSLRRTLLRALGFTALLGATTAGSFVWGYLAHRDHVFPYDLALRLAFQAGWVEPQKPVMNLARPANAVQATLHALPYVGGTADPHADLSGVFHHEPDRAFPGWNLFAPIGRPQAFLVGMDGEVAHRWSARSGAWQHVEPLADGGLLVLVEDTRLFRLDSRSRMLWDKRRHFHHDLWVDDAERIHVLERTTEHRPQIHPVADTVVDWVTTLSADGEVLDRLSLLDLVLDSPYRFILPELRDRPAGPVPRPLDVLHANHVEVFDGRLAERSPLYAKGNLLVSLRTPSAILIADPDAGRILWLWGPANLVYQHHPSLLDDGHVLVFDNGLQVSRVVEVDPLDNRVVWEYRAPDLFSATRGSAQRLPNGNTLITESNTGYVYEVTPEGERVWSFANPIFTGDGKRMAVWRMVRLAPGDARLPPGVEGPS